ncbi:hypothetical protein CA54_02360 [Symmachiella macrocystis]|uniref:Uncharacterized protein n=1 Tax=Symmachiella macrocystis TaxID=2527985 RepID=A0A5C6BJR7_9PLAN|nr:hypothetical protein [Symmachiella macrocystis]TWU11429.1 hypothetical protein CA54_02360 [Symmachiella macrocystis]
MERQQYLKQIGRTGETLDFECLSVRYSLDFNFMSHQFGEWTYFEIGRNDVDVPVVVDPETGSVHFLEPSRLIFINSSFPQMMQSFERVNMWNIPDEVLDEDRVRIFSNFMLAIDKNCFDDPNACWSTMREEIGYGII